MQKPLFASFLAAMKHFFTAEKNGSVGSHFLYKRGFVISLLRRTVLPRYPIP